MKEALDVEKCVIALQKEAAREDIKSKNVSFKDDSKKKMAKDPYDMQGLQKVLKTMSNEMVEFKKQVDETSTKRPFRKFKKPKSKPPNAISNADLDPQEEEEEEETVLSSKEPKEEEAVECHGMWDFIFPNSDTENEQEAFPIITRSKGTPDPIQITQKKRNAGTTTKEKVPTKKSTTIPSQNRPLASNPPPTSKTLVVTDSMDYNII